MLQNRVFQYVFYPQKKKKKLTNRIPNLIQPESIRVGGKKAKNPTRLCLIDLDIFFPLNLTQPDPCTPLLI